MLHKRDKKHAKIHTSDQLSLQYYKNENNTWFAAVLLCMYWQIVQGLYHIFNVVYGRLYDSKYGTN